MPDAIKLSNLSLYQDGDHLIFNLQDDLDIHTTPALWNQCFYELNKRQPQKLTIDGRGLKNCDSAGINLIHALQKKQLSQNRPCDIINLPAEVTKLLEIFSVPPIASPKEVVKERWIAILGGEMSSILQNLKNNISFTGELVYCLGRTLIKPRTMRWKDAWRLIEVTGPDALPIIALVGFLIGMIMGFQGAIALDKFGAKMYVPNFVGITLLRELAPLLTAILVIGRSASAFAAELGSMKLNHEVDALKTMGIEVMQFLVVPRVFASMIMLPLLNIFMIIFGLIGCGLVTELLGMSVPLYLSTLNDALTMPDFLGGMVKAFSFGIVVATIGCIQGLRAYGGADSVGNATTQTVVNGIIMLTIIDGIFSILFYTLNL